MFPLGTVLVPTAVLPLHIFESRYRTLMADLAAGGDGTPEGGELGVVLIRRGSEVGGGDLRSDVGTVGRVIEATQLADGRWLMALVGTSRFRVRSWRPDDPYPSADVVPLDEAFWRDSDEPLLEEAEKAVRRALALASELGEPAAPATFERSPDPLTASWQLASLVPAGPFDRQRLLEDDGPAPRLRRTAALARDAADLLARRLGGAE
ncbi:MAG TPA: LON peptidase substrate-binding domain-containing protein [Acidimicrobiales bacterium]|nr:LON peptidase substrate-binding domain-containing protein [Acidimicrobiales bacterium]